MTDPLEHLRRADPAAGIATDDRAEADLRLLLAETRTDVVPLRPVMERRSAVPVLVTAIVAVLVVALSATLLLAVHSRTDAAAPTPTPSATVIEPPYLADDCEPQRVLPFECGTYRSVYGAPSVTGDTGGPAEDPVSISFTSTQGVLLLTAVSRSCFAAVVPVRYDGRRLVRVGELLVGQSSTCTEGPGLRDAAHWADAFLRGSLRLDGTGGGLVFDVSTAMVTFEYQGVAGIGEPQLPRNDTRCVAAHVAPFACGTFRATSGTGSLAFLRSDPYRLVFTHVNGELTASFTGGCNAMSVVLEPEHGPAGLVVAIPGATTSMGCPGVEGTHDRAVSDFFDGEVTAAVSRTTVTFTKGSSSATFAR
jgi:hypothetical protein